MSVAAALQFTHQSRNNLVELSKSLVDYLRHMNPGSNFSSLQPLLIQDGKSSIISSWSGHFCKKGSEEPTLSISINEIFAKSNGLENNSQVHITLLDSALPATFVSVCPVKSTDWDILNLNSESIEYLLRDQVVFVKSGLVLTYFMSPSLPVLLKVLSTTPSNIVSLQEDTELHILPTSCKDLMSDGNSSSILPRSNACLKDKEIQGEEEEVSNMLSKKHFAQNLCIKSIVSLDAGINMENSNFHLPPYQCFASKELFTQYSCLEKLRMYFEISCISKDNRNNTIESHPSEEIKVVLSINFLSPKAFHTMFPNSKFDELYANPIVLEQLRVSSGNIVTINCYHDEVAVCKGILLHCYDVANTDENNVKNVLLKYLEDCILTSEDDIVLNQGTLLKLIVDGKTVDIVTELMGIVNSVCGKINLDTLEFVTVEKDEEPISEKKECVKHPKRFNCDEITDEGLGSVFLHLRQLLSKPSQLLRNCLSLPFTLHHNVILLHGTSSAVSPGCGKSFIAHMLKMYFKTHPLNYFVRVIDCVLLRGKKVETIAECWNKVVDEAIIKGDAIIIFDDLDELLPNIKNHQDDNLSNIYGEKLSEIFQNLVEFVSCLCTCNIHIIATSSCLKSLEKSLLPNSNIHLFNNFIKVPASIDPMNALLWAIRNLSDDNMQWNVDFSAEQISILRRKMEGFNFKDIQSLVAEVKNLCLKHLRNGYEENPNLKPLCYEQFVVALKAYKDCGKHKFNLYSPSAISFDDIGGLVDVKSTLMENLVWPELYRELFAVTQISLRAGILLYGVPGTAKTMLASAVAYQSKLNFISIKGPELLSKYVGSSESNVRDLFARAQAAKPCILFFDEIDSLAPRRGHDNTGVTDRVVNQLLTQLDGVEGLDRVYILAATSRPDLIDPALLRPGRLDKSILCPLPNEQERLEILNVLTRNVAVSQTVDFKKIASATPNFSGADLKALVYNAQLLRVHKCLELREVEGREATDIVIEIEDFLSSLSSTQPSLSTDERTRFEQIFYEFQDGRLAASQQQLKRGKITLA